MATVMDTVMDMAMVDMVDTVTTDIMARGLLLLNHLLLLSQLQLLSLDMAMVMVMDMDMDMAMDMVAMEDTMDITARGLLRLDMAMVDMAMDMDMDTVMVMVMDMDTMVKHTPESCLRVQSEFN